MFRIIRNQLQKLASFYYDIRSYIEFTKHGNKIERRTDFKKPGLKPVLLIHGFGTTRSSMSVLDSRLRADGFDCFSVNLGGFMGRINTKGIDELAEKIKAKVDSLDARYHLPKFAIIGHSKGGLVGRYYVSLLGGNKHVHTLITLGTPHKGNWWALLAAVTVIGLVSKSLWQMMPHSRFLRKMKLTPIPEDVRTVSIFSDSDGVVPAKRSILPEAANVTNIKLAGFTHTDLLIKRKVYEVVREILRASPSG